MVFFNNKVKAAVRFVGFGCVLYGTTPLEPSARAGAYAGDWPHDRPMKPFGGGPSDPVSLLWDNPTPPTSAFLGGGGSADPY
mgnify:CR=1 FL=1